MSNTLGAPFGGTTRGAHQAFDSEAFSLMIPPNFGGAFLVLAPRERLLVAVEKCRLLQPEGSPYRNVLSPDIFGKGLSSRW